jgi:hypothetical protein
MQGVRKGGLGGGWSFWARNLDMPVYDFFLTPLGYGMLLIYYIMALESRWKALLGEKLPLKAKYW